LPINRVAFADDWQRHLERHRGIKNGVHKREPAVRAEKVAVAPKKENPFDFDMRAMQRLIEELDLAEKKLNEE